MHRVAGQAFQLCRMALPAAEPQILVQYLVLRKDLSQAPFSWPVGALVAQACHAATAALHVHRDHPHTVAYLQELGRMRKVVLEAAYKALQRVNGKWSDEEAVASGDIRYSSFGRAAIPLSAPDETTLKELAEMLQQKNINHILWLEQPENIATCIALRPYPKEEVNQYLKKFRLFK